MLRTVFAYALTAGLCAAALSAQASANQDKPRAANASPARAAEPQGPMPLEQNIRIEVTIADAVAGAAAQKRSVAMTITNRRMGRIRAQRGGAAVLNIDATPTIAEGNRVFLQFTLEYTPVAKEGAESRVAPIHEMLSVMLEHGKAMVVSQAADPDANRQVTVEVTATLLK